MSIEVPIIERSKQTYGAVNLSTQQCLIQAYKREFETAFLKYLLSQCRESNCTAVDGASYHRSDEVRGLSWINQGPNLRSGKLPVFASAPMHQSRIRLRIFGCKENGWCESVTIFANFSTKSSFIWVRHSSSNLWLPSFILMAAHNSFRLLYRFSVTLGE